MNKLKIFFGIILLRIFRIVPPRTAITSFLIGIAALLTTTTTSCGPGVSCYEPAVDPIDTVEQDTTQNDDSSAKQEFQQK